MAVRLFPEIGPSVVALQERLAQYYWPLLCSALALVAAANLWQRSASSEVYEQQARETGERIGRYAELIERSVPAIGRPIRWPKTLSEVVPAASKAAAPAYRVVAVLNGVECSAARSQMTDFLRLLTSQAPNAAGAVIVVVADDPRVVRAYVTANRLPFASYLDTASAFLTDNNLGTEPLLITLDAQDRIVSVVYGVGLAQRFWLGQAVGLMNLVKSNLNHEGR